MSSLDTAAIICSLLARQDLLALYCSSSAAALSVSADINQQTIKHILNSMAHDIIKPKAGYLRRCVQSARLDLQDRGHLNKHLIVLTSNPYALDKLSTDDSTQLHVLCSGALPWMSFKCAATDGWNISHGFPEGGGSSHRRVLRKMVDQMRSGHTAHKIGRIIIDIQSTYPSTVQHVAGSTFIQDLNPGEIKTILVQSNATQQHRSASVLQYFPIGLRTRSGEPDVEGEINSMLGDRPKPILTITTRYEHSAMPTDTVCEHVQQVFDDVFVVAEKTHADAVVQQRLAYHLATSQTHPERAIKVLTKQLASGECTSMSQYTAFLLAELKYQARIRERYEMSRQQILPVLQRYSLFPTGPGPNSSRSSDNSSTYEPTSLSGLHSGLKTVNAMKPLLTNDKAHGKWSAIQAQQRPRVLGECQNSSTMARRVSSGSVRLGMEKAFKKSRSLIRGSTRTMHAECGNENVAH